MPSTTYTAFVTGVCFGLLVMALATAFQPRQITIAEPVVATVEFEHWMIEEGEL